MSLFSKLFARRSPPRPPNERLDEGLPQSSESAPLASHDDELSRIAREPTRRQEFIAKIINDGVWMLATIPGAVDKAKTPDELLRHMRDQAERLSRNEVGTPYTYSLKGSQVLPVFSTDQAAREFVKRLKLTTATAFQCLSVTAAFWPRNEFGLIRVIFNPFSDCVTEFSDAEIRLLQTIASAGEQAGR